MFLFYFIIFLIFFYYLFYFILFYLFIYLFIYFCDFLKNCEFWSKFDITNGFLVKFPVLKMYTFMYFLEFVKKLCCKIKMPKRYV